MQNEYLSSLMDDKVPVTIIFINGFQQRGVIQGFDQYCLIMNVEQQQQFIFRHAISTIIPSIPVDIQKP